MIACLDAAYGEASASAACAIAAGWDAPTPLHEATIRRGEAAAYEPGAFYKRELPLLLAVLAEIAEAPDIIVIDGYVWLDGAGKPGLGAHLHAALGGPAIVGVAKTEFHGARNWSEVVRRGRSALPLFITSAGMPPGAAADGVRRMHGPHRIPTLLQRVDRLARDALKPA